jgi:hypothetical protein
MAMPDQCRYRIEAKERELSLRYAHREYREQLKNKQECKMPEPICEKNPKLEIARLERRATLKKMLNALSNENLSLVHGNPK